MADYISIISFFNEIFLVEKGYQLKLIFKIDLKKNCSPLQAIPSSFNYNHICFTRI